MEMTFDEYIRNPNGPGSRGMIAQQREIAKQVYSDKYNKMMLRTSGNVQYTLFKNQDNSKFVVFFAMPSETTKDLFYDVVIEFTTKDDPEKKINKITGYHVKFFSNDPAFNFTYAYVFNKKRLLIENLKNKLSQKALSDKPNVTNPNKEIGYVKVLYFAYLFMKDRGLFNKIMWVNADTSQNDLNAKFNSIMSFDKKLVQTQSLKELSKSKKNKYQDPSDLQNLYYKAHAFSSGVKHARLVQKIDRNRNVNKNRVKYVKKIK